jgi:hypothetical protein
VLALGADTVAALACPEMDGVRLRTLAWELEKTGRARYAMLETLRTYGLERLAGAGEQAGAAAALAEHTLQVAEQAAAGLQISGVELGAARWLDAEDATTQLALD